MNFQHKKQPLLGNRLTRTSILALVWLSLLPIEVKAQIEPVPEATALSSEAPTLRFEQQSTKDGMAQATANNIMQDKQGFLWIATQGGLHRYDGYEYKVFTSTPFDTTALSDSWVWSASEAANGDLWVTTEGGGLNRLNPVTGKARHYRHNPDDPTSISSDRTFFTLEATNGDLWVSTLNNGLNRMRAGEDGKFLRYRHDPENPKTIPSDELYWLSEDSEKQIWVGTSNGISRIDPESETITNYLNDPEHSPGYNDPLNVLGQYLPPSQPGIIWLATGNGLVRLEIESGNFKRYLIEGVEGEISPLNFIHEVKPDPKDANVLWVAGPGTGVVRFDMRTQQFTSYRHNPGDRNSLQSDFAISLFLDRSGRMWAGTANDGINGFNPGAVNFTHVKHIPNDPSSLAPGQVWGVYEDRQGTVWVGTDVGAGGDYLTQFDSWSREVTWHRHDPNNESSLLPGSLRVFAEDDNGQFWVGGSGGLSLFDRKTGKVSRFRRERNPENRGRNNIFASITDQLNPGILWVGSAGGVDQFDTRNRTFTRIPLSAASNGIEPVIFCLAQDIEGSLWAGSNAGLFQISTAGDATLASAYDPQDSTSISSNDVRAMVERKQEPGILWLGTTNGGGLNRFDTKTGIATHITTANGLADNTIYGLLEDDKGSLWMSTNNGISNYNPETKQFRNYSLDEGLMALEYNQNAYTKANSGMLYFGSGEGVTTFDPERLSTNEIPPQVVISDIKLFNKSIKAEAITGSESPKLTLDYDENEVTFDFVALHFSNPKKNQYRYQLEGFETEWVESGTKRSATYTNLAPGDYNFRVIAANSDGVWNEEGASMQFVVSPPWYRTWWAYMLFAILLGLGIFAVDRIQRFRLNRIEQGRAVLREAELRAEAENKRRADTEELSKIGQAITSTLSMEKIIETIYENVNALMDASVFGVGVVNKEKNRLDFPATKEEGELLPAYSYPLNDGNEWLSVWCFKNEEEIIMSDFDNEYAKYLSKYTPPIVGKSPKSIIYIPLTQQDRTIGVITTQSFTKNAYSEYHVTLLRNLANYAAIALDNASAYRKIDATLSELQSTQQQLVHSEKMASLGELTAGIAHEIQNPLNFVNNFADVNKELLQELREEVQKGNLEEIKALARDINENEAKIVHHGKRAEGIVKSMLQHSRSDSGEKELTDINALCDEYLRLAFHGLRAKDKSFNADFKTELDPDLPKVTIVSQDIGRVLLNLINNAFHAVSAEKEPEVIVATKKLVNGIEIIVKDNGAGIPEKVRDKIFQPFFTTKPTGEGTGLGLSMSYDIITTTHGGELKVNSTVGEGSEFIIILPI